jgi:hypothetical protein
MSLISSKLGLLVALMAGIAVVPAAALAMEPYLPKSPKSFGHVDDNADGKLTAPELSTRAARRFDRYDTDHNGMVTAAEIDSTLQKALEKRRARLLANLDANRDGAIARTEIDAYVQKLLADADGDGDGGVTLAEARDFRVAKTVKPATEKPVN